MIALKISVVFLLMKEITLNEDAKVSIMQHISHLCTNTEMYFPCHLEKVLWIENPFVEFAIVNELFLKEKVQFIEISTDYTLRQKISGRGNYIILD